MQPSCRHAFRSQVAQYPERTEQWQGGRRKEIWDGSTGFHTGLVVAINEGELHGADLLPLSMHGPKHCRFGLDLLDLANIREQPDPRQQIGGSKNRSSRGFVDPDMHKDRRPKSRRDLKDCSQPEQVRANRFQNFIKPPEGKTRLVWVHAGDTILQLKQLIWTEMGYPVHLQHLVSGRWSL